MAQEEMFELALTVNGFETTARYFASDLPEVLEPLAARIAALEWGIVFLAGPPGVGKSTLALTLAHLANKRGGSVQALGMDGFHLSNAELDRRGIRPFKGAPHTYDFAAFSRALSERQSWPVYSRIAHDVLDEREPITGRVLLIEGNYVLLDQDPWRPLSYYTQLNIFLGAPVELLHERLVARKMRGGASADEAEAHYQRTDGPNVELVMNKHLDPDIELELTELGHLHEVTI